MPKELLEGKWLQKEKPIQMKMILKNYIDSMLIKWKALTLTFRILFIWSCLCRVCFRKCSFLLFIIKNLIWIINGGTLKSNLLFWKKLCKTFVFKQYYFIIHISTSDLRTLDTIKIQKSVLISDFQLKCELLLYHMRNKDQKLTRRLGDYFCLNFFQEWCQQDGTYKLNALFPQNS